MKKAGSPKNTTPHLDLHIVAVNKERKHLLVETEQGTEMLLAYDAKLGGFHLHCYTARGNLGGKVYNDFTIHGDIREMIKGW